MQAEKRWYIVLSLFCLLVTSSQCMESKEVKETQRKTLLNLILQVIGDRPASRRVTSGLYSVSQDVKISSREKIAHLSKLDHTRPIGWNRYGLHVGTVSQGRQATDCNPGLQQIYRVLD
ncbi:hypothetical protein DNTS_010017 [Danionella cerebrum]|uniref:Uncharacterized protein n=1 Tax=Danionella cerebrum TaxID=2873325 RepID=A0A553QZG9_9TELE|nr:hypothetical protein DNTS_010017 [Danionella translucida]